MNFTQRALTLAVCLTATPLLAHDGPAIPFGATPSADVLGHVFFAVCHPTRPALLEDRIALAETAFGWEAYDAGTDVAYRTPDGAITVTLDGNPISATCQMTIDTAVGGDGAALYDDLVAHLSEDTDDAPPPAEAIDGGLIWTWDSYSLSYTESAEAFTLTLEAK